MEVAPQPVPEVPGGRAAVHDPLAGCQLVELEGPALDTRLQLLAGKPPGREGLQVMEDDDKVYVYSAGFVHCSVCAPAEMTPEEVASAVNLEQPTGISSPWEVSSDPEFADGSPNPAPCSRAGRRHWLLAC